MRLRIRDREAAAPPTGQAVRLDGVRKEYGRGDGAVVALDGVTAGFDRGSFTAVMGPSGSGKSTFLHMAAGLDRPTESRRTSSCRCACRAGASTGPGATRSSGASGSATACATGPPSCPAASSSASRSPERS